MNQINKFLKLSVKSIIIYLVVLLILYFVVPIFPLGSLWGLVLGILAFVINVIFFIAIVYSLAKYFLSTKPQAGFKKFNIKIFIAIILIPALALVVIDLLRIFISAVFPESVYNTIIGVGMSRAVTFLFAIIWFIIVIVSSTKQISDKKQKRNLIITIVIAIIIYLLLYYANIV